VSRTVRSLSFFLSLPLSFAVLAAAACKPTGAATAELSCSLVYLKTGSKTDLSQEERDKVFAGHFANMTRLAREGHLLLAGPFGKGSSDPNLRGLFVFDAGDAAHAKALAETDPGVQAGVFAFECHDFATAMPLRDVVKAQLAEQDAAERAGKKLPPGTNCRDYVLLIAVDGARARSVLEGRRGVLLLARYDGTQAFAILDAKDVDAAKALLGPALGELGTCRFEPWFATNHLAGAQSGR
jgi:uncharacterized protein YciI